MDNGTCSLGNQCNGASLFSLSKCDHFPFFLAGHYKTLAPCSSHLKYNFRVESYFVDSQTYAGCAENKKHHHCYHYGSNIDNVIKISILKYPLRTPRTRLSMKKDPMTMRGMKKTQLNAFPRASFVCNGKVTLVLIR